MKLVKILLVIAVALSSSSSFAKVGEMDWRVTAGLASDCTHSLDAKNSAIAAEAGYSNPSRLNVPKSKASRATAGDQLSDNNKNVDLVF